MFTCPEVTCLPPKLFCYEGQCYAECPSDTVVIFNNECVRDCPYGTMRDDQYSSTCVSWAPWAYGAGASALGLLILTAACIFLLRNPKKTRKSLRQLAEEAQGSGEEISRTRQQVLDDDDETKLVRHVQPAVNPGVERRQVDCDDTHLEEVAGWNKPLNGSVPSRVRVADGDETLAKSAPSVNDDGEDFAPSRLYQRGRLDDDDVSSVPTVVAMRGFMDSSLFEGTDDSL